VAEGSKWLDDSLLVVAREGPHFRRVQGRPDLQEEAKVRAQKIFQRWDADGNKKLSLEEYKQGRQEMFKRAAEKKAEKQE
jgi:hypothetical protein